MYSICLLKPNIKVAIVPPSNNARAHKRKKSEVEEYERGGASGKREKDDKETGKNAGMERTRKDDEEKKRKADEEQKSKGDTAKHRKDDKETRTLDDKETPPAFFKPGVVGPGVSATAASGSDGVGGGGGAPKWGRLSSDARAVRFIIDRRARWLGHDEPAPVSNAEIRTILKDGLASGNLPDNTGKTEPQLMDSIRHICRTHKKPQEQIGDVD